MVNMKLHFIWLSRWTVGGFILLIVAIFAYFAFVKQDDLGFGSAPHVVRVEVPVSQWNAQRRIVHVLAYHLVPREMHEGQETYEQHVADARAVQEEQRDLLRHLANRFKIRTPSNLPTVRRPGDAGISARPGLGTSEFQEGR
jgi:hypothetical protein